MVIYDNGLLKDICERCGKEIQGEYSYRKVVCDKCDAELDEKVAKIVEMLDRKKKERTND